MGNEHNAQIAAGMKNKTKTNYYAIPEMVTLFQNKSLFSPFEILFCCSGGKQGDALSRPNEKFCPACDTWGGFVGKWYHCGTFHSSRQ